MFNEQHIQAIGYVIGDELALSVKLHAALYGDFSYVDPNLIVLFFLLLFCLLYALVLAFETVSGSGRTTPEEKPDWVSKRS